MALKTPILFALLVVAFASAPAAAEDAIRIPGTNLSLVPPPEFAVARGFPGLENEGLFASIVVSELPTAFGALADGLTAEALEARGMSLQQTESVRFGEREGTLVRIEQTLRDVVYEKWMGLMGNESRSVFVAATYPRDLAERLRSAVRASMLSATWNPDRTLDAFDGLPFRIRVPEGLEIVGRSHALVTLSTAGTKMPIPAAEPYVVVGASVRSVEIPDIAEFSRERLEQTNQLTDIAESSGKPLRISGRPAYELVANATTADGATPVRIYQVIVTAGSDYTIVQGITPTARSDEFFGAFEAVARSLRFP